MCIAEVIRKVLSDSGHTQAWVISKMNAVDPNLEMNRTKFSAIVCGSRKMTGDELLAFCRATQTNPDVFCGEG